VTVSVTLVSLLVVGALLFTTEMRHAPEQPAPPARGEAGSLAWHDEFNGPKGERPNPRKWSFETGYGWGDRELQSYTARRANASLDGRGHLAITARRERYTGADGRTAGYTSARINSRAKFEFAYGRVEARIRVPRGRGILPAFWALGRNLDTVGWPASGEIDAMEVNGREPFTVHGTLHGARADGQEYSLEATRHTRVPLARGFHLYGISWSPGRVAFLLDGDVYGVQRRSNLPAGSTWSFDRPFFLLLNVAVGPRWLGAPDATTRWPARMLVDWLRVRLGTATFCPRVRAAELRADCPRRPAERAPAGSEAARR
jgi:beta-glucanase (GH16 family)